MNTLEKLTTRMDANERAEHEYLNCPACGGSGHIDDYRAALSGADREQRPAALSEPKRVKQILDAMPIHGAVNFGVPRTEREHGWNEAMAWVLEKFGEVYVEALAGQPAALSEAEAMQELRLERDRWHDAAIFAGNADSQYKRMFEDAVRALAEIDEALGIEPDGCNDPQTTVSAIKDVLANCASGADRERAITGEPYRLNQVEHDALGRALQKSVKFIDPVAITGEPVAHVPIHPRIGPLWMDTFAHGTDVSQSRPMHYPTMALYFRATAGMAIEGIAAAAKAVVEAYDDRFGRGGNFVGPIDEEIKGLRSSLTGETSRDVAPMLDQVALRSWDQERRLFETWFRADGNYEPEQLIRDYRGLVYLNGATQDAFDAFIGGLHAATP
jgi:hypothetical protein